MQRLISTLHHDKQMACRHRLVQGRGPHLIGPDRRRLNNGPLRNHFRSVEQTIVHPHRLTAGRFGRRAAVELRARDDQSRGPRYRNRIEKHEKTPEHCGADKHEQTDEDYAVIEDPWTVGPTVQASNDRLGPAGNSVPYAFYVHTRYC